MQAAEFLAEATGLETSHMRTVSRRLREADMLSQSGHGRGAAAATPQDAALLLLVGALGVPPLHAVRIGEAVLACTIGTIEFGEAENQVAAGSAIDHVASLIATGEEVDLVRIILHGDALSIVIADGAISSHFQMPEGSLAGRRLAAKFGGRGRLVRTYRGEIRNGVLPEISAFLGLEAQDAEDSAA